MKCHPLGQVLPGHTLSPLTLLWFFSLALMSDRHYITHAFVSLFIGDSPTWLQEVTDLSVLFTWCLEQCLVLSRDLMNIC